MKYTYAQVLGSLSTEKKKSDGTITRFFYRPLSFPLAWFCLNFSISANTISFLGMFFCLVGVLCTLLPFFTAHVFAICCFFIFAIFDCADGTIARTSGKHSVYGAWVDAIGGYFAYTTELFALGFSCFYFSNSYFDSFETLFSWGKTLYLILAGLAVSSNLLMRLFFQAKKNADLEAGIHVQPAQEKKFSEEIGITGYLPLFYVLGLVTGFAPIVLFLYTGIYTLGFFVTSIRQMVFVSCKDR